MRAAKPSRTSRMSSMIRTLMTSEAGVDASVFFTLDSRFIGFAYKRLNLLANSHSVTYSLRWGVVHFISLVLSSPDPGRVLLKPPSGGFPEGLLDRAFYARVPMPRISRARSQRAKS